MQIADDRWFKLKLDNWIKDMGNQINGRCINPYGYVSTKRKVWYEQDFYYPQIAESLAEGSKYTPAEVEEYLKTLVASAKLEAILDNH